MMPIKALKALIEPIQMQLLKRGMCVACFMPLKKGERVDRGDNTEQVTCKCGRIFIFDKNSGTYRRALLSEV